MFKFAVTGLLLGFLIRILSSELDIQQVIPFLNEHMTS
jgi:hypothetical protein